MMREKSIPFFDLRQKLIRKAAIWQKGDGKEATGSLPAKDTKDLCQAREPARLFPVLGKYKTVKQ
jgi:hypothetical protein